MPRVVGLLLQVACSADRPRAPDKADAAPPVAPLPPPVLMDVPRATSVDTLSVHGTTMAAARVVVQATPGMSGVANVLPSGVFCQDVPLARGASVMLKAYALRDGQISPPATATVLQDPTAAPVGGSGCAGIDAAVRHRRDL
jgi:hypothetical protein